MLEKYCSQFFFFFLTILKLGIFRENLNDLFHRHLSFIGFVLFCFVFGLHSVMEVINLILLLFSCKSCLTFCDPMDCSLPGSSVHRISQA